MKTEGTGHGCQVSDSKNEVEEGKFKGQENSQNLQCASVSSSTVIIVSINVYFLLFVVLMYTSNNKAKWGKD